MRDHRDNVLAARATVTATATLGAITGFMLGCVLAIPLSEVHLKKYLERVTVQEDASVKEAHQFLNAMQHLDFAPCSDAELSYFREIVFRSEYLKDAGRIRGGQIECSATAGHPSRPIGHFKPGPAKADGTVAYSNLIPIPDQSLQRVGIQQGKVFVVFGSHFPVVIGSPPVHLAVVPDEAKAPEPLLHGTMPSLPSQAYDSVTREGDILLAEHCSPTLARCVTASVSVGEARRGELVPIACISVFCGMAGACLGVVLCFFRRRSQALDQQLKRALAEEKLNLEYQPIVDLANRRIVGAEALARWTTKDGVSVSPDVFIRAAEEHGFVGSVTNLVLRRALKEFHEVLKKDPDFRLSINVAAADLVDPGFLPMLDEAVKQSNVPPGSLAFEVTERSAADCEEALESIRLLRRRGHNISIDDFGTGYSNLSYLLYLSADTIKIDKAFIRAIGTESVTVAILPQIIAMARSLNLGVVVEGIESEGQARYFPVDNLRIYGQGWLYGRPMPAAEFFTLLGVALEQPPMVIEAGAAQGASDRGGPRRRIAPALAP
jgi:sensor c-di-GMP phosphodiesterase-like protein